MYSEKHGLTPLGREQGQKSAAQLKDLLSDENDMENKVVFYTSSFARAKQTAQECLETFIKSHLDEMDGDWEVDSQIHFDNGLIER